ncbi:hypothetical protein J6590_012208 [Homalodisca vitripennis]|nr:hypothetical protein J6590_012208 [Homalodisca vitripennis]
MRTAFTTWEQRHGLSQSCFYWWSNPKLACDQKDARDFYDARKETWPRLIKSVAVVNPKVGHRKVDTIDLDDVRSTPMTDHHYAAVTTRVIRTSNYTIVTTRSILHAIDSVCSLTRSYAPTVFPRRTTLWLATVDWSRSSNLSE